MQCRICNNKNLKKFLSLGRTPLANSFISKEDLEKEEEFFPLGLCLCDNCKLVQLTYVVEPEKMFKNYIYASSTSNSFRQHFIKMTEEIAKDFGLNRESLAVDIGSNDGILLKGFQRMNLQIIGVEPATNIARIAEDSGIETINDFFNSNAVKKIVERKGHADVITATNVFAHINNIGEFVKNVKSLLKKNGIFVIEVQYLADTIEKMTFDNIYHEHLSYFSLTSLNNFFKKNDMEIFDALRVDSHGGSLRAFIKKSDSTHKISNSVKNLLEYEKRLGIDNLELYAQFADNVYNAKHKLLDCLSKIKSQAKTIAGYGAPAKGNTLLNFCNIGTDYIGYIAEDSPLKVGLYTPGTHIPVVSPDMLDKKRPDYILILAWNFANEIMAKTKKYTEMGTRFIIPLPEPVIF